jgi:phosphatidylglycerophosphate synthase
MAAAVLREVREIYWQSKKPVDDFWTEWISRPPAALCVYALRHSRVTPNQVTLFSLVIAVLAAVVFLAWPGYAGLAVGGVVFQIAYVLDCTDGQLARLRGTASALGADLDFFTDEIKALLLWGSVSLRLWFERGDLPLILGIVGMALLAANLSMTKFMRGPTFPAPPSREEGRSPRGGPLALVAWIGKWVIQYPRYLMVVCLIGRVEIFFYAYLAANILLAARSFARIVRAVGRPLGPSVP